jgi:probable HAF family extracellular repeat protein
MNKILANCISLGIGLGAIGVAFPAQSASFQKLTSLPGGGFSPFALWSALGVSADGSVVVGVSSSPNAIQAFRWTQATGVVILGDLPGGASKALLVEYQPTGLLLLVGAVVLMVLRHSVGHKQRGWSD